MLVSGGLEHAGGIGRWAGYLQDSWLSQKLRPPLVLIDTRGDGHAGVGAAVFALALARLAGLYGTRRLGVIHANLSIRGSTFRKIIVGTFANALGVPLVLHLHGAEYAAFHDGLPRAARRAVHTLFARAAQVVVLGGAEAGWLSETLGVPRDRITVLPNGVVRPPVPPPRPSGATLRLVLLGRIGARKGVPELLDALSSETMRRRSWQATLAGDGEVAHYAERARALGLGERVSFPGWIGRQESSDLLAGSDILVLPSHAENLPMSVIEALAHGVAVVTTPVGAVPDLLTDGQTALLVPPGDAAALAAALARLIDDEALRCRLAAAGRALFDDRLDIDGLARRLATLHSRIIND